MKKHLKVTLNGRVQGVCFRASTKQVADNLGISGFIRNQDDGSVYLEAESNEETLNKFLRWLQRGPGAASVDNLDVSESEMKNMSKFEIKR